jgi:Eco57I restriction-modification methylase
VSLRGRRRRRAGSAGEAARRAHAWLELLQTSGPFLTLPVVSRVFPDGLPAVPAEPRALVRARVAAMMDDGGASRHTVIETLLREVLDWGNVLLLDDAVPVAMAEPVVEYGLTLRPDLAFHVQPTADGADEPAPPGIEVELAADPPLPDDDEETDGSDDEDEAETEESPYRLLGMIAPWGAHPLARVATGGWTASPAERLAVLLRARDVPIGLVTDGRWWGLVWAPHGGTTGVAVWDAAVFGEEPDSLRALVALLGRARFLGVAATDTLPSLLKESLEAQEEVTETLGRQVREAVELLILTLDRLDADSDGALLAGVDDDELYAGAVTVMMRIVFLLFAEDRRLLPSDDDLYLAAYSVSTLVEQLEQRAQLSGEQALEHRTGAWHRLLATTRALHGGVAHEDLRLPAYGGSLFDPAVHPWLEAADRIDDRTVLRMLRAVQYVELDGERRRLTFRALDVEQIGYVYEGLLELEVRTAAELTLALSRPTSGKNAWPRTKEPCEVAISQLAGWLNEIPPRLSAHLKARLNRSESAMERALQRVVEEHERRAVTRAVSGDPAAVATILPLAPVLHWYEGGIPAITLPGRRYVAPSTRRTTTGTHYTPRSLAEEVAIGALEPLVYRPGPLEIADRSRWRPRPSTFIETLKVADIAMGSGAFLVAACRYLADRMVEAWRAEGRDDALRAARAAEGKGSGRLNADAEVEQVVLAARRIVAERCLYGVDINPLAVEMAKLSLWLVTMDKERPFGFLDDRFVVGDSLLGLVKIAQLEAIHVSPDSRTAELDLSGDWVLRLEQAADLRRQITASPVVTVRHVEHKQRLLRQAGQLTEHITTIADAITGVGLRTAALRNAAQVDTAFAALRFQVGESSDAATKAIQAQADRDLQDARPPDKERRRPLHWPVTFPEVLVDRSDPGFDAIIGNPPFLGGKKISGALGDDYLAWLARWDGGGVRGHADLAARFVLRVNRLLNTHGQLGYITTNTLVQGDTLQVGLAQAASQGLTVRAGRTSHPWPSSSASLEIVDVWASAAPIGPRGSRILDGEDVPTIGPDLEPVGRIAGRPFPLAENDRIAFQGSNVLGLGFMMSEAEAQLLIERDPRNAEALQPYVIGKDLNQRPDCSAVRGGRRRARWPGTGVAAAHDLLSRG